MRKGTKSCIECRRRKIRCTYKPDRPEACNECRLRGSTCIDQEQGPDVVISGQPERYSLRERVTCLEAVVQDLIKRLDDATADNSIATKHAEANLMPTPVESDKLGPSSDQIGNAPVMQLFDNYHVRRHEDPSNNDQFTNARDTSPKARAAKAELVALLPPLADIFKIMDGSSKFWYIWEENAPEARAAFKSISNKYDNSVAPGDIAKAVICLSLSVMQAPPNFDFNALQKPLAPEEFTTRCTAVVDRWVVRDDEFAATLPGIETQMLLCKHLMQEGRLRKAWLINRRALEFAHLAGMHLSTRSCRPSDPLFERRLRTWCWLAALDRTLSLVLGLPYGVADAFFLPQVENRLKSSKGAEQFMLRIGVINGRMIDHNQNPAEMCLESTVRLDQELMDLWKTLPSSPLGLERGPEERVEHYYGRVAPRFMPQVFRCIIHMPVMLKYLADPRFSYCHRMAIQSAREGLAMYKVLRPLTPFYRCKVIDFLSFTMGMLLIVHLIGHSKESSGHSKAQDQSDWQLVGEVAEILRQASDSSSSVASEAAHIIGEIFNSRDKGQTWSATTTCKVTVPYFGTITVGGGSKCSRPESRDQDADRPDSFMPTSSTEQIPTLIYTPSTLDSGAASDPHADHLDHPPLSGANYSLPREDPAISNFPGLESNRFTGLYDDFGQYTMWPNPNMDLGLEQGWNLNWCN
ncbi:hypothetical protein N7492_006873 [Penicillium capsulatum]|uniref:Zn(2)-C6 fungal-type domain-containing protein n=1 Tax=Penicillium capsulatum TaxID=69766 RepID=A0A9W9I184_9EURO|nr:hypothetical protein N7492_006873 [Penicillium capsulatum]